MSGDPFSSIISQAEQAYNLPAGLLGAVAYQESSFNPSIQGGMFQIMAATAANPGYGVSSITNVNDPSTSANFAAQYLSALYNNTGSWVGALQSYGTLPQNLSNLTVGQQNVLNIAQQADGVSGMTPGGGYLGMQGYVPPNANPANPATAAKAGSWIGSIENFISTSALRVLVALIAIALIGAGLASLVLGRNPQTIVRNAVKGALA